MFQFQGDSLFPPGLMVVLVAEAPVVPEPGKVDRRIPGHPAFGTSVRARPLSHLGNVPADAHFFAPLPAIAALPEAGP